MSRHKDIKNVGLHTLYVQTACVHLQTIDKTIKKFSDLASTSMSGVILALYAERAILVNSNVAYYDANEILASLRKEKILALGEGENDKMLNASIDLPYGFDQ